MEVKRYNIIYLEVKRYNIIYLEVKMYNIIYFGSKEVYKCFVFVKCSRTSSCFIEFRWSVNFLRRSKC